MKHKETITDKIVKNINQALEMIPRALHLEGEKQMRKSKMSRRTAGKKRAGRSSARKSVAQGVKRAKRQTVKSRSKTGSRTRVSAMGRFGQSIRAARSVHGKIGTTASKRALKARKKKARKTPRTRKQTVTRLIAPVAQAA